MAASGSLLQGSTLISDRGPPVVVRHPDPAPGGQRRHYVYVDNLGVISPHIGGVTSALSELVTSFNGSQLILHPGEVMTEDIRTLGALLKGGDVCSRCTGERFQRLRQAGYGLLRRGRCSGQTLEIVVGHMTFVGLGVQAFAQYLAHHLLLRDIPLPGRMSVRLCSSRAPPLGRGLGLPAGRLVATVEQPGLRARR